MKREDILDIAKEYVTKDRNSIYGEPEDSFKIIADLWNAYLELHIDRKLDKYDVAILMMLLKTARMKNRPNNPDSAIDAAGYAACAGEILGNLQTRK